MISDQPGHAWALAPGARGVLLHLVPDSGQWAGGYAEALASVFPVARPAFRLWFEDTDLLAQDATTVQLPGGEVHEGVVSVATANGRLKAPQTRTVGPAVLGAVQLVTVGEHLYLANCICARRNRALPKEPAMVVEDSAQLCFQRLKAMLTLLPGDLPLHVERAAWRMDPSGQAARILSLIDAALGAGRPVYSYADTSDSR